MYNSKTDKNKNHQPKSSKRNSNKKDKDKPVNIKQRIEGLKQELKKEKRFLGEYNKIISKTTEKITNINQLSRIFTKSGLENITYKPTKNSKVNRMKVKGDTKPVLLENQHGQRTVHKKTEGLRLKDILDINIKSKYKKIDELQKAINKLESGKKPKPRSKPKNVGGKKQNKNKKKKKK